MNGYRDESAGTGRVAAITGAGQGIGRAIALKLSSVGYSVVVNDRDPDTAEETAQLLRERVGSEESTVQPRFAVVPTDISQAAGAERLVEAALRAYGRLDVLVNNAAIVRLAQLVDLSEDTWDEVVDTNLKGAYLCCRAALPYMMERGNGVIINISSNSAYLAHPKGCAYAASKAGMVALTRSLAREVGPAGIRVVTVVPGWIATESNMPDEKDRVWLEANTAAGRAGTPEEVADVVAFLVGPDARYITGQAILVDGGLV